MNDKLISVENLRLILTKITDIIKTVETNLVERSDILDTSLSENTQKLDGSLEVITSLANGWVAITGACTISKTGKLTLLTLKCSGGITTAGTMIYQILNGIYKPIKDEDCIVYSQNSSYEWTTSLGRVRTDGKVLIYNTASDFNACLNFKIFYESVV